MPALAPHFRIELTRPARLDVVTLEVEPRAGAGPDAARNADRPAARIKSLIGVGVELRPCEPGGIARSGGKAQRLTDQRPRA